MITIEETKEKPIEEPKENSIKKIKYVPYKFEYIEFNKFDEAFNYYNINPKNYHLKIISSPNSLETIYDNGNIITVLGEGLKSSPGYPCGNQILDRQMKLINHFNNIGTIDVFHQNFFKKVVYMGRYGFSSYRKRLSFSGFAYFEFTLSSYQPRDRYKVFNKPNIPLV
jgi:hypothetical protein